MKRIVIVGICILMISSSSLLFFDIEGDVRSSTHQNDSISYVASPPIRIDSNADFTIQGYPGSGTVVDPWIIDNLEIDGTGLGYCIYLGNVTDYFVISNGYFHNASGIDQQPYFSDSGVILYNIHTAEIANNTIENCQIGLSLNSSHNSIIHNNTIKNNNIGMELDGQFGFHLYQTYIGGPSDNLGRYIAAAGDVDDDGYDDIIVGATNYSAGAGRAYVYSGYDAAEIFNVTGEAADDGLGIVSGAGDVNNDGYDDVIIGAPYNDEGGADAGKVYVYSGLTGLEIYNYIGEFINDGLGGSVSDAGDVNKDGYGDFITGADNNDNGGPQARNLGEAYLYSGIDGTPIYTWLGENNRDEFGHATQYAGDVNNDGFDDVIISAYLYDNGGTNNVGKAYVMSGETSLEIWSFIGENQNDNLGRSPGSVSWVGDVDNDGFGDVIVGAGRWEPGGSGINDNWGRVYVYSGQTGANIYTIDGENLNDRFGRRVCGINDVNNDGTDDFIAAAPFYNSKAGRNYVFSGATGSPIYYFDGQPGDELAAPMDAGDVNADGYPDIVMGAWMNSTGGVEAGTAYVYTSLMPGSNNNTMVDNEIKDNTGYGMYVSADSVSNSIYHNNFIANMINAYDDGQNTWNDIYPSGGNHWDDYSGIDLNGTAAQNVPPPDGIGDTAYTNIAGGGGNVDQYPFMFPFGSATFNIPLLQGWNLISYPVLTSDDSLADVLDSINGKWDCVQVYDPLSPEPWRSNNTFRPDQLNDLSALNNTFGFWIYITETNVNLTVNGMAPTSTSIPLYAGWNLVGYPSNTERMISDSLAGTGYDRPVEGFNMTAPYRLGQLADTYMMKVGEGYWIHVPADSVWIVDW